MLQTVIFDVDGTLVDSVDLHARSWQEAFSHFGKELPFDRIRGQIGKGADQLMPVFLTPEELERMGPALEKHRGEQFASQYLPQVRGFPKVRELFERLRGDGIRVALASSAKGQELSVYKRVAAIEDLVEEEASKDDANASKPHPDIFQAALERLGNPPLDSTVVIGDTPYDAQAALAAGLPIFGVLCGGFPESDLRAAGCSEVYQSPADLLEHYGLWTRGKPYGGAPESTTEPSIPAPS